MGFQQVPKLAGDKAVIRLVSLAFQSKQRSHTDTIDLQSHSRLVFQDKGEMGLATEPAARSRGAHSPALAFWVQTLLRIASRLHFSFSPSLCHRTAVSELEKAPRGHLVNNRHSSQSS